MRNRDQIRAKNALDALRKYNHFKGVKGGDPLTGFPALIIGNGLLSAIAFCKKSKGGWLDICNAIATHLGDSEIGLLPGGVNVDGMLEYLIKEDSGSLRLCTEEAIAYLNYLRRFAKADNN